MTDEAPRTPDPTAPAHRFGAPREASVPRMEHVRITAPDLARRAMMEKTRGRLVLAAAGFAMLFACVGLKLADATIIQPVLPRQVAARRIEPPSAPVVNADDQTADQDTAPDVVEPHVRAMITDRNGQILAVSLPTASVYANPRELTDSAETAHRIVSVLPKLDEADLRVRLADTNKQFVYIARQITPREELRINGLGIPGVYFQPTERRRYPMGRVAAQVLGGVDVDGHGVAGTEKAFEQRLRDDPQPLRLSIDVRVQALVRDELASAMADFEAIGGAGMVMDVHTGEIIAMVSLPDYDANDFGRADPNARRNRAINSVFEPGSTFKLQNVSAALDDGVVNIWNGFDATSPIHAGRYTINDFQGKHRFLYVPEIIAYSSNIGAAHMAAAVGSERQRAWMEKAGMMTRVPFELPETAAPLVPPVRAWKELTTMTVGFGQGIAVTPLHVVVGTATVANGGIKLHPTILALGQDEAPQEGTRIMQQSTSDTVRKLMRLVVTEGVGKSAEVPGYFVGGKTGTAQKTAGGRGYVKDARVAAFAGAFPMNAPRYMVYMMLDEPKPNASTHGYATAGWVVAPAAAKVIAQAAPMLGLLPDTEHAAEIDASLAIPLQPGKPGGAARPAVPVARANPPAASTQPGSTQPGATLPGATLPASAPAASSPLSVPTVPPLRDLRHEATYLKPSDAVR
jgi:cell division protein FtsI (penicillin-binding protein 3)